MRKLSLTSFLFCACILVAQIASAEDGYEMWLRYQPVSDNTVLKQYRQHINQLVVEGESPTLSAAVHELQQGIEGLLNVKLDAGKKLARKGSGSLVIGTPANSSLIASLKLDDALAPLGDEGFLIRHATVNKRKALVIAANSDIGVLYGAFHLLRMMDRAESC